MDIEHLLTDDQDELYTDGDLLRALFEAEFLMSPTDVEFPVYSWKDWLKDWEIREALQNGKPVLLKEWNSDFFPKEETVPPFFESEEINEKNLLRFGESNFLQPVSSQSGDALQLEYWVDDEFRRIHRLEANPLSTAVYMQHDEDFACMVYMGIKKSLFGKTSYICSTSYKELSDDIWRDLNASSPAKYRIYLENQWKAVLDEYKKMNYWWNRFQEDVTVEKVHAILMLPLIQEKYNGADQEGKELYFGSFIWTFYPKEKNREYNPRLSIALELADDDYDFYHFDIEGGKVVLYTQDENEDNAAIYGVSVDNHEKIKSAVCYFEKLNRHIYRYNDEYLAGKDIEVHRFELMKGAFRALIKLCLSEPHLSIVDNYIQQATEEDCEVNLLDEIRFFCENEHIPFLICLDWKAENADFYGFLFKIVGMEFGFEEAELEQLFCIPEGENTSLDTVMKESDSILRKYGLQLGLANDYSDQYIFFVHRTEASDIIRELFKIIDYDYEEARDF